MPQVHPQIPEQFRASKEELEAYKLRLFDYHNAMVIAKEMFKREIIDRADYAKIEQAMADKYEIGNSVLRWKEPE